MEIQQLHRRRKCYSRFILFSFIFNPTKQLILSHREFFRNTFFAADTNFYFLRYAVVLYSFPSLNLLSSYHAPDGVKNMCERPKIREWNTSSLSFSRVSIGIGRVFKILPTYEKTWKYSKERNYWHFFLIVLLCSILVWSFLLTSCVAWKNK